MPQHIQYSECVNFLHNSIVQMRKITKHNNQYYAHEDQEEHLNIQQLNQLIVYSADKLPFKQFLPLLAKAVREITRKIQNYIEADESDFAGELIQVLETWVVKFKAGEEISASLCLVKAMYHLESKPEIAKKFIRKAKYLLQQSNAHHITARILLLQSELYFQYDGDKAYASYQKCIKYCQKNAMYYSIEKQQDNFQELKTVMLASYYKLAVLDRMRDNYSAVAQNLKQAFRQAVELYGYKSAIAKRLEERYNLELIRMKEFQKNYKERNLNSSFSNEIYLGEYQYQDANERKTGELKISHNPNLNIVEVQLKIQKKAGKREKLTVEFPIEANQAERVNQLGKNLKWFSIKDNRIEIQEKEVGNILKEKKQMQSKGKNLLKFIQKKDVFRSSGTGFQSCTSQEQDITKRRPT